MTSALTLLALFGASASALSAGSAQVINKCSYPVYLCSVPAAGGGYEETDKTLATGESWTQDWTQLTNGNGWSIKLSKDDSLANILQYEYTFQNDGTIWYDLSCVNGNPWDGNWEISSPSSNCSPRQAAYMFATDDAFGEQSCPQDASITVTLCSGDAASNGTGDSGNSGSSASAPVSSAPAVASVPISVASPVPVAVADNWNGAAVSAKADSASQSAAGTPTTFATLITAAAVALDASGDFATAVEVEYVTEIITQIAAKPRARRHEHHPHHRHA